MIDTPLSQSGFKVADRKQETLQEYVCALLARQQALDSLETIHQQIHHVSAAMLKLLDDAPPSNQSTKRLRAERAAMAAEAQNSYQQLENRRDECIALLHQAECRANAALHGILVARAQAETRNTRNFSLSSAPQQAARRVCRPDRRKQRNPLSERS
jgi:DNA repair exonuclease SbcCD ATPase subunit